MIQPPIQSEFSQFGPAHISAIAVLIIVAAALSLAVRRSRSEAFKRAVCWTLVAIMLGTEWFNYVYTLTHEGFYYFVQNSLPLHVCGLATYLGAYMLITKRQLAFEIIYFWGLAGTPQAILTPIVKEGFPSYRFFHFFIMHSVIIVAVCVAAVGLKMRPRWKGLWVTYGLSWMLAGVVGGLNLVLNTNYMYLCGPPPCVSPFYFLDWPWYIPFLGVLALVLFTLLWLPYGLAQLFAAKKPQLPDLIETVVDSEYAVAENTPHYAVVET